MFLMIRIQN